MDPVILFIVAFSFAGSKVAHKLAGKAIENVWEHGTRVFNVLERIRI